MMLLACRGGRAPEAADCGHLPWRMEEEGRESAVVGWMNFVSSLESRGKAFVRQQWFHIVISLYAV